MARALDPAVDLVPRPSVGRAVIRSRRVRLGDVTPRGRLRLDALARYLQDIAADDADESAPGDDRTWVVRRTLVRMGSPPVFGESVELTTWCSGYGSRWAERRTSIAGPGGGAVEAVSLWVHVDTASGRPARLDGRFHAVWGPSAGGRRVGAGLRLPDPPVAPEPPGPTPWALRVTDFDVLGHVNNAAYWEAVEERLAGRRLGGRLLAEIEYRDGIVRGEPVTLRLQDREHGGFDLWFGVEGAIRAVARVLPAEPSVRP